MMTSKDAIKWLEAAARYFEKRETRGEDSAFWSNTGVNAGNGGNGGDGFVIITTSL